MNKALIREFGPASTGEEGLHPYLNERGVFVGDGAALLTKDNFGDFAPLPQRDLEIVLSAGFGFAVDLGSRMHSLATLAKALNEGDYALAAIALAQAQFPALPDKGASARMQKAAAMLERGASAAEVLKQFLSRGELAKFNPYHLGPGLGGGQFTTADMDGTSSGDTNPQCYATNLSEDEILDRAQDNVKTPGWLQPKDVKPGNDKQCVSLVRAVIPELPHSSQWQEGATRSRPKMRQPSRLERPLLLSRTATMATPSMGIMRRYSCASIRGMVRRESLSSTSSLAVIVIGAK